MVACLWWRQYSILFYQSKISISLSFDNEFQVKFACLSYGSSLTVGLMLTSVAWLMRRRSPPWSSPWDSTRREPGWSYDSLVSYNRNSRASYPGGHCWDYCHVVKSLLNLQINGRIRLCVSSANRTYELSGITHVTPFRRYGKHSTGPSTYGPWVRTYKLFSCKSVLTVCSYRAQSNEIYTYGRVSRGSLPRVRRYGLLYLRTVEYDQLLWLDLLIG